MLLSRLASVLLYMQIAKQYLNKTIQSTRKLLNVGVGVYTHPTEGTFFFLMKKPNHVNCKRKHSIYS